jgi:CO/xanthine dehydrogenase Mo-binding subunit
MGINNHNLRHTHKREIFCMADLEGVNGQRENFRVVGKPNLPGRLSWALAAGVAKFGADYIVPGMLHAKFLRSPYANVRIGSIDTGKAKKIPGVVDILTWEDEDIRNLLENGEMMMGGALSRLLPTRWTRKAEK